MSFKNRRVKFVIQQIFLHFLKWKIVENFLVENYYIVIDLFGQK